MKTPLGNGAGVLPYGARVWMTMSTKIDVEPSTEAGECAQLQALYDAGRDARHAGRTSTRRRRRQPGALAPGARPSERSVEPRASRSATAHQAGRRAGTACTTMARDARVVEIVERRVKATGVSRGFARKDRTRGRSRSAERTASRTSRPTIRRTPSRTTSPTGVPRARPKGVRHRDRVLERGGEPQRRARRVVARVHSGRRAALRRRRSRRPRPRCRRRSRAAPRARRRPAAARAADRRRASTTVDSIPASQGPASSTRSTRSPSSFTTCAAVVGESPW